MQQQKKFHSKNTYKTASFLEVQQQQFSYHALPTFFQKIGRDPKELPFSIKILLENLLRHEDGVKVQAKDIEALALWNPQRPSEKEIQFMPARVLLQDFTGVPAIADLAAMRSALKKLGGNPDRINPRQSADLVVDHSVQVDHFGSAQAFELNAQLEFERNEERYQFLKWGQQAFKNFRVVPPGTGIVHQVHLEHLAQVAIAQDGWIYPDTVVGTDSHTTMINGLGILAWGVGGIEAEAALLGQPCSMLIPEVVGFRMVGELPEGSTATDLVLTVTQMLRNHGVVGRFVEFFGSGIPSLSLADRATLANMAPEYGATIGLFPIDDVTLKYLKLTGREGFANQVKTYYQKQGLWYDPTQESTHSDTLTLDLADVKPCLAGPSRPQDRVLLNQVPLSFQSFTHQKSSVTTSLTHGSVVIAAITSCTNTSNPSVLIAASLLAKKACEQGLSVKPWVKTSFAPGSKVVTDYLTQAGLMTYLERLKFHLVGYGCTTCIGNSGPLPEEISRAISENQLSVVSVLSGNRNFEGRVHTEVQSNYLASPPLVIAYAIAGNIQIDLETMPLGTNSEGKPVFFKDIWPSQQEIQETILQFVTAERFEKSYSDVFAGGTRWKSISVSPTQLYPWNPDSTYIQEPPFLQGITATLEPIARIEKARILAFLGDSITTDHISPAGAILSSSPAGKYLRELGVAPSNFNAYGARRGNHEVMVRGTSSNTRLKNRLAPESQPGSTCLLPDGKILSIFDAAMEYQKREVPLIIIAGKEYGTGSSRDWAAKGPKLLGVRAVIAESFERIHRSNLVGMGILPLQFLENQNADTFELTGKEEFSIINLKELRPSKKIEIQVFYEKETIKLFTVLVRIDTPNELEYFRHGGILPYVLRQALD